MHFCHFDRKKGIWLYVLPALETFPQVFHRTRRKAWVKIWGGKNLLDSSDIIQYIIEYIQYITRILFIEKTNNPQLTALAKTKRAVATEGLVK